MDHIVMEVSEVSTGDRIRAGLAGLQSSPHPRMGDP